MAPSALNDHHPLLSYLFFFDTSLDNQCAGYDYTHDHNHPRRCTATTSEQDQAEAIRLLSKAAGDFHTGRMERLHTTLAELAPHVLCPRISHQTQAPGLVARWGRDVEMFMAGGRGAVGVTIYRNNETWRARMSRGVWEFLDRAWWTRLVPRILYLTCPERSPENEQAHVEDFDWDYGAENVQENEHQHQHQHDYNSEHEHEFEPASFTPPASDAQPASNSTNPEPLSHTPVQPWDIPAEPRHPRLRDSDWGLLPSPGSETLETPRLPQRNNNTKPKPSTVYALRHPIDGECSICFTSLLEHPADFNDNTPSSSALGADEDTETWTEAETEQEHLTTSPPHSIHRWYDTDTGEWGYTDATGTQHTFHPNSCRTTTHKINLNLNDAESERPTKPPVPELSWCKTGCGVNYHRPCIEQWIALAPQPSCPTCRGEWVGEEFGHRLGERGRGHGHGHGLGHRHRQHHRVASYSYSYSLGSQGW
ncbi:hypothetical protein BDW74DRAFT_51185 [Aspergillus multicolor]|uniref:uncharacterized protein n=1 Tax=Aspergillus multicolor TaxID=41759 RepID=UPI003CCDF90F